MSQETVIRGQSQQSLTVKNLITGLTEIGKIKIGIKGRTITSAKGKEFQPPTKLDHFLVTTLERGPDNNYIKDQHIHELYGDKPKKLPILLVYDNPELNWQSRYIAFRGKNLYCSGDGETAMRITRDGKSYEQRECPCHLQNPEHQGTDAEPKCKISGVLSCLIQGCPNVGGVYKFRTTSYNSVVGITSSMALLTRLTCGPLAGLPLNLTINPKTVVAPGTNHTQTVYVVGLEYPGSLEDLRELAYAQVKAQALYSAKIDSIEGMARKIIGNIPLIAPEEQAEIVEEFYPEQAVIEMEKQGSVHVPANGTTQTATVKQDPPKQEAAPVTPPPPQEQEKKEAPPDPPQEQEKKKVNRRRTHVFDNLNPDLFADGKLQTCGVTPTTILQIKKLSTIPVNREKIQAALKEIGYEALSYLRQDEAEELLRSLQPLLATDPGPTKETPPEPPPPPEPETVDDPVPTTQAEPSQPPEESIHCPMKCEKGESVYKSYCYGLCDIRKADGFCPILGETPPNTELKL